MAAGFETGLDRFIDRAFNLPAVRESGQRCEVVFAVKKTSQSEKLSALNDYFASRVDLMVRIAGLIWVTEAALVVGIIKFI